MIVCSFGDNSFDCGKEISKYVHAQVYNKKVIGFLWNHILWGLIVLADPTQYIFIQL